MALVESLFNVFEIIILKMNINNVDKMFATSLDLKDQINKSVSIYQEMFVWELSFKKLN